MAAASFIVYLFGLVITLIAFLAAYVYAYLLRYKKGLRDLALATSFISFLLFTSYLLLVLDVGYTVVFGIPVPFVRFAVYIATGIVLSLMFSRYFWREETYRFNGVVSSIIATSYLLIAVLLPPPASYIVGGISFLLHILVIPGLIMYTKRKDLPAWTLIGIFSFFTLAYVVVLILSPVFAQIIPWDLVNVALLVFEFAVFIFGPWWMVCTYCKIPCDCVESPEGCGPPLDKPKCPEEYGYYKKQCNCSGNGVYGAAHFGASVHVGKSATEDDLRLYENNPEKNV